MEHPIKPPDELVWEWTSLANEEEGGEVWNSISIQAAQWGADQELEACCEWLDFYSAASTARGLRAARRPKPLSEADVALAVLDDVSDRLDAAHENTIRLALERLKELEALPND